MADSRERQTDVLMCDTHNLEVDMICDTCVDFICPTCVRTHHKTHDWKTISAAASIKRRECKKFLRTIDDNTIPQMEGEIAKASAQIDANNEHYRLQSSQLRSHYSDIVKRVRNIRKTHDKALRDNLDRKNDKVNKIKSRIEENKNTILDNTQEIRENMSTLTDIDVLKLFMKLTKLKSTKDRITEDTLFSMRHEKGNINEEILKSTLGQLHDFEENNAADSFQWGDRPIIVLEAINDDTCLLRHSEQKHVEKVNKNGTKENQYSVCANDLCSSDASEVYGTDKKDHSIFHLSKSGFLFNKFLTTYPLEPYGICQANDGLLITLADKRSNMYELNSQSRRLVRRVTLQGHLIREYEYKEDDHTRLFILPVAVVQNGNTDICVINMTSKSHGELVILSSIGSVKSVYSGKNEGEAFLPTSTVCDFHLNIILSERNTSRIHILNPNGEFVKYLLTENEIMNPTAMSLRNTSLWIGNFQGIVKVFKYPL